MTIIHISAECYPVAKVGGLADVVGALPKYQSTDEISSKVIMPFYDNKFTKTHSFHKFYSSNIKLGSDIIEFNVLTLNDNNLGFDIFFVDVPSLLFKDYVYSSEDTERFLAFQIATLDWLSTWNDIPDIVHCHDHHTGLTPFMMRECLKYERFREIPSIFTIHNAQYQGWFSHDKVGLIPEFNFDNVGLLDWGGTINPLAAAIKCAWRVTTVSPSYMEELKTAANGLEGLLSSEADKCVGVLNGIDTAVWNTETDPFIDTNYSLKNLVKGKTANKAYLCKRFNLDPKKPLFAFIGRLVLEKGADLFPEAFKTIIKDKKASILLLGSGNPEIQNPLEELLEGNEGIYNAFIGYDEALSHNIYAGADFLLMPSRVEPCGLNQMYSLRYGTVPIVRSIGGLKDTVTDISDANGFGICHQEITAASMVNAVNRAIELYNDKARYRKIQRRIMAIDHSWNKSAETYINLYELIKHPIND
ncbi:glycogen synthase [Seonamhaeicola marinus]|uniref:Glycogen synthase n=1 Tax=Seonamhaeicola marinus TaxID=1912246 RepID=A0A5D0HS79_9FLAO|nr:glycogen/starch synthase [Seonamhaeicola marinus]TYA74213.1 glycogen synthase [Seonamhaeicola marinus]